MSAKDLADRIRESAVSAQKLGDQLSEDQELSIEKAVEELEAEIEAVMCEIAKSSFTDEEEEEDNDEED